MNGEQQRIGERFLLRWGAVAAIIGTALQVAAGSTSNALPSGDPAAALKYLVDRPDWLWPAVYLGFIFGALLWVGALVALTPSLTDGASWALGRLATASIILGVALHAVDGALNGVGLASLADAWATSPEDERTALVENGDLLLRILDGTWAGVITLFHGVPFVLAGLAVALSPRYPAWLGWLGFIGGAGSVVTGVALFLGDESGLYIPFAVILSGFMVILGGYMWSHASSVRDGPPLP